MERTKKLKKLPPGWLFHHDLHLMVFRPRGTITAKRLEAAIVVLEEVEDCADRPFNRFTDLSKLEAIHLDFRSMFRFSLHRRLSYSKRLPVRSAIYVTTEETKRMAKLHALLTDYSPLKVKLFNDMSTAAKWLGVLPEILEIDPWANEHGTSSSESRVRSRR